MLGEEGLDMLQPWHTKTVAHITIIERGGKLYTQYCSNECTHTIINVFCAMKNVFMIISPDHNNFYGEKISIFTLEWKLPKNCITV